MTPTQLTALATERNRLLRALAPMLLRVGSKHPKRSTVNKELTVRRKRVRRQLKDNANRIVVLVMLMYGEVA